MRRVTGYLQMPLPNSERVGTSVQGLFFTHEDSNTAQGVLIPGLSREAD